GELVAIVGPNGCGKSTLLNLLIGALNPQSGQITLDGQPLQKYHRIALAQRLALVPQMSGGGAANPSSNAHASPPTKPSSLPATQNGRLVILVTHDLNLAATCATRVLVLDSGRLIADGPPQKVLTPAVLEPVYHVKVQTQNGLLTFSRTPRTI